MSPNLKDLIIYQPIIDNYRVLFYETPFIKQITNTLIISIISTILVMVVSLPAAYSFARFNPGKGSLLFFIISTRMSPAAVGAIPFFIIFKTFGLLDTRTAVILMYLYFNMTFATFLLYGFFREIPIELEQSAMIDGYGRWNVFRRIVLPLIMPGAAITTVFCLVFAYNEFLFAFLFTREKAQTLSVGISLFWGGSKMAWGPMAACVTLATLPTILASWFMQRYIVRGLTFGAVKG
jgi:multiple sugar transport system permease protein